MSDRRTAKQEMQAFKAFRESPAGRARAAAQQGHKYFQVSLTLGETVFDGRLPLPGQEGAPVKGQPRAFEEIEAEGWRLVHMSCVCTSQGTYPSLSGIYLFESAR